MVEVTDDSETEVPTMSMSVYVENQGEVIPSILGSIAAQTILNGEAKFTGIVPLHSWLSKDRFMSELSMREIKIGVKEPHSREWKLYSESELMRQEVSV